MVKNGAVLASLSDSAGSKDARSVRVTVLGMGVVAFSL